MSIKKRITSFFAAAALMLTAVPAVNASAETVWGDISGNGTVDLQDAIMVAKYLLKKVDFDKDQLKIADYNGDGKVDLQDAIGIAKFIVTGKPIDRPVTEECAWVLVNTDVTRASDKTVGSEEMNTKYSYTAYEGYSGAVQKTNWMINGTTVVYDADETVNLHSKCTKPKNIIEPGESVTLKMTGDYTSNVDKFTSSNFLYASAVYLDMENQEPVLCTGPKDSEGFFAPYKLMLDSTGMMTQKTASAVVDMPETGKKGEKCTIRFWSTDGSDNGENVTKWVYEWMNLDDYAWGLVDTWVRQKEDTSSEQWWVSSATKYDAHEYYHTVTHTADYSDRTGYDFPAGAHNKTTFLSSCSAPPSVVKQGDKLTFDITLEPIVAVNTDGYDYNSDYAEIYTDLATYNGNEIGIGFVVNAVRFKAAKEGEPNNCDYSTNPSSTSKTSKATVTGTLPESASEGDRMAVIFNSCGCHTRWIYEWIKIRDLEKYPTPHPSDEPYVPGTPDTPDTPDTPSVTPAPAEVPPQPDGTEIISTNYNVSGVSNKPQKESTFKVDKECTVYNINTYHWNNGKGTETSGTISLLEDGVSMGTWGTIGENGQNGCPNAGWNAYPENLVLSPGHVYTVIDSDPDTWSCNSGSEYMGFYRVTGVVSSSAGEDNSSYCRIVDARWNSEDNIVEFTLEFSSNYADNLGWVGLFYPDTPDDEVEADKVDISSKYINKLTSGEMATLKSGTPDDGEYELRVYADDDGGELLCRKTIVIGSLG